MLCKYTFYSDTAELKKRVAFRFAGVATHFVLSANLEALEYELATIDSIDHNKVHETIEKFAVKKDHKPSVYTLHGQVRKTIDRYAYDTITP